MLWASRHFLTDPLHPCYMPLPSTANSLPPARSPWSFHTPHHPAPRAPHLAPTLRHMHTTSHHHCHLTHSLPLPHATVPPPAPFLPMPPPPSPPPPPPSTPVVCAHPHTALGPRTCPMPPLPP